jgi:hypothetical protein
MARKIRIEYCGRRITIPVYRDRPLQEELGKAAQGFRETKGFQQRHCCPVSYGLLLGCCLRLRAFGCGFPFAYRSWSPGSRTPTAVSTVRGTFRERLVSNLLYLWAR